MNRPAIVTFGEIMLRLSPQNFTKILQSDTFKISCAGSEANVAVSLSLLNENVQYVTALSNNDLGLRIRHDLQKYNLGIHHIIYNNNRQGLIFIEKGAIHRPSKVIYDREDSAFSKIQPGLIDWQTIFAEARWFHWSGISPALSENLYQVTKEAIHYAKKAGVPISVDLNYRGNLWKYNKSSAEVMTDLTQYCDVIIGNEEDAIKCLGIQTDNSENSEEYQIISKSHYERICSDVCKKFPRAQTVCFTLRESVSASHNTWSAILYNAGRIYHSNKYNLTHIVDRVGAGDSFSAGIIYGINNFGTDFQHILDFATASSALKHSIEGDFNLSLIEDIEKLLQGHTSGRITR
ncbi:MAG: sugar kinase [Proteobacteria bacterium]|nr:sugar kinase [Desulfocapsa sp.]MBU3946076.1 sugar kinase [Pseudomonadota bacterium]MCG2744770.1 sugar kinase [Desulfobacteraceae bacterium]MBU4028380.1 sugar kinase [Pseudomonadota bacterium]MBU4042161.1 sugar kinase [Pseudomonadota bacterium]